MKSLALKINKRFYYGWVIVFVSALAFFFSAPGQTYSISIFINVYETEFGYSKTALSTGYSIATTISGLLMIFVGRYTDKFGQRVMLVIVATMLAFTTFYNSFSINIWMIFSGFFFLRFFGQGSMTLIPNSLVPQWFEKKRALAISLSEFGNFFATLLVPIFNVWLIHTISWQNAWRFWGFSLLLIFVPLVLLLVINRPEDVHLTIENDGGEDEEAAKKSLELMTKTSFTLKQTLATRTFWFAGFIGIIAPMFTTGITFHWIAIMAQRDISREAAAITIGLVALPFATAPFLARAVIDRFPIQKVLFTTLSMFFTAMVWLAFFVNGMFGAVFFILFYGLAVSVQSITMNTLWPHFFGRKYLGSIRGATTVFMVLGSALGPLPFGVVFDRVGSFVPVILGMMVMTLIAMILALFIRKPEKPL